MDAATLEETNRLRLSLGMKPLPVPGAQSTAAQPAQQDSNSESDEEEPASTLETRSAQAYDNYNKAQEAEAAKRRREEKAAAVKKARDAALRFATLEGRGLGESDLGGAASTKDWLMNQKKRQKKIDKARKLEEELAAAEAAAAAAVQYTAKDLAGVKVAHDLSSFLDGDDQILTLKDTTIEENEEEGDELENVMLRDQEKLNERLDLKKKKPVYDVHDDTETSILAQYDEEIHGKKRKNFTLAGDGEITQLLGQGSAEVGATLKRVDNIDLGVLQDGPVSSDYLDISEIKVKKPKKKKSTRKKAADDDDIFAVETAPVEDNEMEIDSGFAAKKKRKATDDSFIDDEDLQASLSLQRRLALKKRKVMRPEDMAKQLRKEASADAEEPADTGLVINDITEFVAQLRNPDDEEEEKKKPQKPKPSAPEPVTAMAEDSDDEDHPMNGDADFRTPATTARGESADPEAAALGVEEEKAVSQGMGATLALLKERGILKPAADPHELNTDFRRRVEFLRHKQHMEESAEEAARAQRERDRASGRMDRMSERERQELARQQNERRDLQQSRHLAQLFQEEYKPKVELKYVDEYGRRLDQKEAFKHLSHQFHGKGSGKGKTDKKLKKIEDEKRREAQSMLDASQNVGMSSATAMQLKKRKEAGVRLA